MLEQLIPGIVAGIAGHGMQKGWWTKASALFWAGMLVVLVLGSTLSFVIRNPPPNAAASASSPPRP